VLVQVSRRNTEMHLLALLQKRLATDHRCPLPPVPLGSGNVD
jgi:hypothetical protein